MMMFKRDKSITYPFSALIKALKAKDADLYASLCHLSTSNFWREWKKVHPEDFPQGGLSPASPSSVNPPRS